MLNLKKLCQEMLTRDEQVKLQQTWGWGYKSQNFCHRLSPKLNNFKIAFLKTCKIFFEKVA